MDWLRFLSEPHLDIGAPGYVYINYRGLPEMRANEVTIGTETITFTDHGRSVIINGSWRNGTLAGPLMKTPSSKRGSPDPASPAHGSEAKQCFLPRRVELLTLAVLVTAAVAFTHWPVRQARAISFDDQMYLTANPLVQRPSWASAGQFLKEVLAPSTVQGYYQPLAMISLMLDYAVARSTDNLRPFHTTSLTLHLANTLLILWLLYALFPLTRRLPACREGPRNVASPPALDTRRDFVALGHGASVACQGPAADAACQGFGRPWIAAAVALLFGVHPMTVEPIAWVGERKTLLAAFFALLCLVAYVRYAKRGGLTSYLACLGLYVLALMSKPTSTPVPLLLLLLDFWPLNRLGRRALLEKVPFLAVAGIFAAITIVSQASTATVQMPGEHSLWRISLIVCHDLVFYLCKIVWPTNLTSHYPVPAPLALSSPMILLGVIGTCVLVPALLASLRWTRALLTGWLIFLLAIFPTLGVIGFTNVLTSDKYAYLPAIGYLLILAWLFDHLASTQAKGRPTWRPATLGACVLATAGLLAIGTRHYLQEWQTSKQHNFYMLRLAPNSPYVHTDCGNALADEGDYPRAIWHYTQAINLAPWLVDAYYNRGHAFDQEGNTAQAISDYSKAVSLNARHARAYNNRGAVYDRIGDYTRAMQDCSKAVELNPEYAEAYANRGSACKRQGDFAQAIRDCSRAIELKPDLAQAYYNRGNVYNATRDFAQAIRDYTRAIELKPDFAEVYNNRGNAYNDLRDSGRAIQDYAKAIELKLDYADAYCNRANTYSDMGDFKQAIRDYSKAIELKPGLAQAYNNRGNVYNATRDFAQAIRDCTQAIELKPDFTEAYNNRGNAYNELRDFGRALQDYSKAIELKPDLAQAYNNRGNVYTNTGDFTQAIRDYSKALELKPDNTTTYHNRAVAYYQLKQFDKAWEDLKKYQQAGGQPAPEFVQALSEASGHAK